MNTNKTILSEEPKFGQNSESFKLDPHSKEAEKNVQKTAEAGRAAVDTLQLTEEAESVTGKVSEVISENAGENIPAGSKAQTTTQYDIAAVKIQILKNLPSEKEMKKQIEKEVKNEIKYLRKKAMRMISSPNSISFFEMNNLVKKIRELRSILSQLLKASFESLKTLWLRYVHGIM